MPVNDGTLNGWPFVNHGMGVRGTQTTTGPQRETIVYPRRKYTYIVEFQINPLALLADQMQTNVLQFLKNGRIYASLRSIDHPRPNFEVETLRSYNKYVKVKTKTEFEPATLTFHDDNSSIVMALFKEYMAFYSHAGSIGRGAILNPQANQANEFRLANSLVGEEMRSSMDVNPSVGMTLRPNNKRHFFDAIAIYDLGSDPDSINVYHFVHPVITSMDQEGLDYFDREGQNGITWTMEYENYYYNVGLNSSSVREVIESVLGYFPETPAPKVGGHATMNLPVHGENTNFPVDSSPRTGPAAPIVDGPPDGNPVPPLGEIIEQNLLPPAGDPSLRNEPFPDNLEDSRELERRLGVLVNDNSVPEFIRREAHLRQQLLNEYITKLRQNVSTPFAENTADSENRTRERFGTRGRR